MRETVRAVLTDQAGLCFLAVHNHFLPENIGKWGTVGGIVESGEGLREALERELIEEFGGEFQVGEELGRVERPGYIHHFFRVTTLAKSLRARQPEEVLECRFFALAELQALAAQGRLYFPEEVELYKRCLAPLVSTPH